MNKSRIVFIPAILLTLAALVLILYGQFGIQKQMPPGMNGTGSGQGTVTGQDSETSFRPERGEREEGPEEIFKTLGTIAVFSAAASYAWITLKKKRRSASTLVRKGVKLFYAVHTYTGYLAMILIAIHGVYFLIQGTKQDSILTGIGAFVLLLSTGVYGFLIKRVRNKYMRTVHLGLGSAFLAAGLVHAGGSAILAVLCVIGLWILIRILERTAPGTPAKTA
ncbi:hypothetical protein EJP77_11560 [Paenibacillus zeisoli]|uniref:Uncharacterized protein n=1 Tax=Paenibacillus zeisoli TaxID=2496267 RepID=A0A433X8P5_9BACL|nr:hypothetical protein [Paenibacillus zeisoli]RUT30471.1 hypothetical protein EJP77_11560 [Paenibacillus zeisoli]